MRLAYFTPLPPSKSGIADYNAELLPYLARGAEITVFIEEAEELRENQGREDYAVDNVIHFEEIHRQNPFDLSIYHQGNNPYHEYIYERALAMPGLLVLHEHCLHHLIAWKTLGRNDEDSYRNELFFAYGRRGARVAEMRDGGVSSEYQQFLLPLNRRLVTGSLGVIAHNAYAISQLEGVQEEVPVELIPHHLSPKVYELDEMDKIECRRSLGIPDDAWVIASLGFVTQSKRIPAILAAFKRLLAISPKSIYLIVGEDHWKWSVAPLIDEMELKENVRITGYTSERDFFRYLKAVDVIVNLRFPTAGETSGTLIRALGAGKPVIVTDFGQFGDLPDDVCLKVSPGPDEEKELYSRLRALAYRPTLRESLSKRASEWTRRECEISRSAARYLAFAERIIEREKRWRRAPSRAMTDHRLEFEERPAIKLNREEAVRYIGGFFTDDPHATGYLSRHGQRIIETVELIPVGAKDQRLLELSSYLQMAPLIKKFGNYGEVTVTNWWQGEPREKTMIIRHSVTGEEMSFQMKNVDVERDRFPFPDSYFDVALCCELIEHLREDPMHMLIELNRVLKWGGLLVLTTPNIASAHSIREALSGSSPYIYGLYNRQNPADRHSREYTFKDVRTALEASGFKVVNLFTANIWHEADEEFMRWLDQSGVPRELRGDNIFAVGRKLSTQFDRYPDGLYE
ncbi:MAG: methyltransferase domain-containing protein [Acidobacteria bacterium]|nr:methyltransferase domain-containing protein [Acidobacteriota bacterium]MCI0664823.1 methyltransferase domain-containing protein [Acidobacteriota bacterium]